MTDGGRTPSLVLNSQFRYFQRRTLGILYLTYGGFYLSRKADSVVKAALHEEEGFTVEDLAFSDTMYLFTYTIALGFSGVVGNYVRSNVLLAVGLVCLGLTSLIKSRVNTPWAFALCQMLHAVFQSTGWPTCVRLVGTFTPENRGFVMGIWTTCQSLGGIMGTIWATYFMTHYGYHFAYFYIVPINFVLALVCFLYIADDPETLMNTKKMKVYGEDDAVVNGLLSNGSQKKHSEGGAAENGDLEHQPRHAASASSDSFENPSLLKVISIPGVIPIGVSYFFLKFLRYALLMWLPYYYEEGLHFSQAVGGYMSTSFEVGGLIGTPLIGWFSDRHVNGRRDLTAGMFMAGASVMLVGCIVVSSGGALINAFLMFSVGILVIGPDSILSGTIAQDIGSSSAMGPQVIGTLAGLINSVGSCGSIFQSYATAYISRIYGWNVLFMVFVLCAILSAAILFHVAFFKSRPGVVGKKRFSLLSLQNLQGWKLLLVGMMIGGLLYLLAFGSNA